MRALVVGCLFASCETVITLDIPIVKPKLVVNGAFSTDSTWRVIVSESQHILDNAQILRITTANVKVFIGSTLIEELVHEGNGVYTGSLKPAVNQAYTMEVSANGYDQAWATDVAPLPIQIFSTDTNRIIVQGYRQMQCKITFTDDGSARNFYMIRLRPRVGGMSTTTSETLLTRSMVSRAFTLNPMMASFRAMETFSVLKHCSMMA